jgi:hypothetical protein
MFLPARPKVSPLQRKKLYPSKAVAKANSAAHREDARGGKGVLGFCSLEIIRNKPGITFKDFLKDDGTSVDLRWEAAMKRVEARA